MKSSQSRFAILSAVTLIALSVAPAANAQVAYSFTTIDFPGASRTLAQGVNNAGQVVGYYSDAGGLDHGFLRSATGAFTSLNFPGANTTQAQDINSSGQIVGQYFAAPGTFGSFLLSGGTYTTINFPGATRTFVFGINAGGQIVGDYGDAAGVSHGFLLSGGTYATIDYPGSTGTGVQGINAAGLLAGGFADAIGDVRGFSRSAGGVFTPIVYPGGSLETDPTGVNAFGTVVGDYYTDTDFLGFLLRGDTYSTFPQFPGFTGTIPIKINDLEQVVGYYSAGGAGHGFLATPVPEPTSLALLGVGGLAVMWRRRRQTVLASMSIGLALGVAWFASAATARAQVFPLYGSMEGGDRIMKFTSAGVGSIFADFTAGLSTPTGLAFDATGNLYVANANSSTVVRFTTGGGPSVFIGSGSLGQGPLGGMAFDSFGNLFVAVGTSGTGGVIKKFSSTGADLGIFASSGISNPYSLAFDTMGNLYVPNGGNNTIRVFTPAGVGSTLNDNGLLNHPTGITFDSAGNLYAANGGDSNILKFTGGVPSIFAGPANGVAAPFDLAFDSAGNLYVANSANQSILELTPGGVGSTFASGGLLSMPFGLAFTPSPVPEPGTLLLCGLGALGFALRRKSSFRLLKPSRVSSLIVVAILSLTSPATAQYVWTGAGTNSWNQTFNWSPSGSPNSPTATASFTGNALGTVTIDSLSVQTQSLLFSNPTGNYTLTSSAGLSLSGVSTITVAAGVTGVETINLANISTGSLLCSTSSNLSIVNNSTAAGTTLVIGPNTVIGTPGSGSVVVFGAGTTQISGSFAASPNNVVSGLVKSGTGTLILSNPNNNYLGGTFVNAGTLAIAVTGTVLPAGQPVTVQAGAVLDYGPYTNTSVLGSLNLAGTLRATGASSSDIGVQQLNMTGGTVDFGALPFTWLHVFSTAGITTNASVTTARLIGPTSGNCQLLNDAGSVSMPITVAAGTTPSGIDLDVSMILACRSSTASFNKLGNGTMRLTNTLNTANITVTQGVLRVDTMAALGSGAVTLANGTLQYGGVGEVSTKNLAFASGAGPFFPTIQVLTNGANLTLNGTISGSSLSFQGLNVAGSGIAGSSSTLTLGGTNTYSGQTIVGGNVVLAIPTIADLGVAGPLGPDVSGEPLYLGANGSRGTLLLTGTNPNYSTNRVIAVTGQYANGGGGAVGVANGNTNLVWSGSVAEPPGGGALIKIGPGTLTLTNSTNSYAGGTYIEAGTLNVGANGAVIPANTDVTVSSGATLQLGFTSGDNFAAPLRDVTLNGGTLLFPSSSSAFYSLNRLVTGATGGTVDFTNTAGALFLVGTGSGATINGNTNWVGSGNSGVVNTTSAVSDLTIAPNATLTCGVSVLRGGYRIAGGGTLYLPAPIGNGGVRGSVVNYTITQGRLRADDLSVDGFGGSVLGSVTPGLLTLDGGTLQYTGSTASTPIPINLSPVGGAVEVSNAATILTLTGAIGPAAGSAAGPLNKTGPGVLILNNLANTYAGGITVSGGRLDVADDAQLGDANPTVNAGGTLRYTANAATGRTFNLVGGTLEVPTGGTLALDGATVNGGFLRGAGTFALAAGTTLNSVTTQTSTTVNQTGTASVANFSNGGAFTVGAGQTLTWNGGTNTSSGRLTVTGTVNANDFVSNGLLTVAPGGVLNHTGSDMVLGGGSTTFVGSVANPGGKIDLGGQQLIVRGGFLVTNAGSFGSGNGVRNGTTVADYGALVKGTGPYQAVITQNGGQYLPGNSPGTSQVGQFFVNGGGNLIFEITDAGPSASFPSAPGTAGANPGWGLTQIFTSLEFTATPSNKFNIDMRTQLAPPAAPNSPGQMSNFDPNRAYSWKVFDLQPGAVFNGTFNPNAINFITTQVANSTNGGAFSLSRTGGQVFLTFTPVPEPALILGVAFVGMFGWSWQRRRRHKTRTA